MAIQTAGEQKYYDLIEEKVKSLRTAMIVGISFLALALISVFSQAVLGIVLGITGALLTAKNIKEQKKMSGQLDGVGDKDRFFNQLILADTQEIPAYGLVITKDYIVQCSREELYIRARSEIKGAQIHREKGGLVLTVREKNGDRHVAARTKKKEDTAFRQACNALQAEE